MTGTPSFDLTDRVALVTGGSRGLGRAMVRGFAAVGADVVIASRKLDACQQLADEIERSTGRAALPYACHVGHWDALDALVDTCYERFGRLDILVNNVGISPLYGGVLDITEELWDKVFDVTLKATFRLSALVGTRMGAQSGGSIINISSGAAIRPTPDLLPYAAAKAAVNTLTVGLARAFGPTVRVNCIMAGPFRTDASRDWDPAAWDLQAKADYALQRIGEPEEIVGAALYLASDLSSYTTGSILRVDGGLR